jgi:hypothetical protein
MRGSASRRNRGSLSQTRGTSHDDLLPYGRYRFCIAHPVRQPGFGPESIECSKEADAKGLHGKERKKVRSECKKAAMEKK